MSYLVKDAKCVEKWFNKCILHHSIQHECLVNWWISDINLEILKMPQMINTEMHYYMVHIIFVFKYKRVKCKVLQVKLERLEKDLLGINNCPIFDRRTRVVLWIEMKPLVVGVLSLLYINITQWYTDYFLRKAKTALQSIEA